MSSHAQVSRRRRDLLRSIVSGAGAMAAMGAGLAPAFAASGYVIPVNYADPHTASQFWARPRVLKLFRPQSGEAIEACFWRDGQLDMRGYLAICRLLRDVRAGQAATIDVRLLNLMRGMQGWLQASYGIDEAYQVNSGYRTEHTNATTEGAVKNSLHTRGQAVDGRFPSLPIEFVGQLQAAFRGGGTGIYVNKHKFVHSDVGRVRQWRG